MKKKSSYQKLKEKISKLEQDINTLVINPYSMDAELIRTRHIIKVEGIDSILFDESRLNKLN